MDWRNRVVAVPPNTFIAKVFVKDACPLLVGGCQPLRPTPMLQIDKDILVHGLLVDEHVEYPENIFERERPIFSATIMCDDYSARAELADLFEMNAGPCGAEIQDQPADDSLLKAESIIQPQFGRRQEDGQLAVQPGDHVTLGIRIEMVCPDGITDYLRVTLRSIQGYIGEPMPDVTELEGLDF